MRNTLQRLARILGGDKPATQSAIASYLGVSVLSVNKWNTGKVSPSREPYDLIRVSLRVGETMPELVRHVAALDSHDRMADLLAIARAMGVLPAVANAPAVASAPAAPTAAPARPRSLAEEAAEAVAEAERIVAGLRAMRRRPDFVDGVDVRHLHDAPEIVIPAYVAAYREAHGMDQ